MSDGKWSGGTNNRTWVRPGSRRRDLEGDAERAVRLYDELAGEPFLCDVCGRMHALSEHRSCRERDAKPARFARVFLAAVALAVIACGVWWLAVNASVTATP